MIPNTPEYLVEEIRNNYGIDVPLETAITYLDSDPHLTPETLYMYVTAGSTCISAQEGEEVSIPRGFTVIDLSEVQTFEIPLASGNYIWLLKDACDFPQPEGLPLPVFNRIKIKGQSYRVMYTGKASSLYRRLWRCHLRGMIRTSTLRKTLAALMGFRFEHYMSGNTPKVRITAQEELKITRWLCDNCILLFKTYKDIDRMEEKLIASLDPPLNIDMNPNLHNGEYVARLSLLRKEGNKKASNDESLFCRLFVGRAFKGTSYEENKMVIWLCILLCVAAVYVILKSM